MTDAQKKQIKLFNEKARKILNSNFLNKSINSSITISSRIGEPVNIERKGPKGEDFDACILTYRFFVQNNEKTSFAKMAQLYEELNIDEEIKAKFREVRQRLNIFLNEYTPIIHHGKNLTRQNIQEVFLYGGYAHANERKKEEYDSWMEVELKKEYFENEFVFIVGNVLKIIEYIYKLNLEVLNSI